MLLFMFTTIRLHFSLKVWISVAIFAFRLFLFSTKKSHCCHFTRTNQKLGSDLKCKKDERKNFYAKYFLGKRGAFLLKSFEQC